MTTIVFNDNRIVKSGDIYRFAHHYEITIMGARIHKVDSDRRMIHFVITDSSTKTVLDDFVGQVAKACGIHRASNINNIMLSIPANIEVDPDMSPCDIIIEWRSFTIISNSLQIINGGMRLVELTAHDASPKGSEPEPADSPLSDGTTTVAGTDTDSELTGPLPARGFGVSYKIEPI